MTTAAESSPRDETRERSIIGVVNSLLRHAAVVVGWPIALAVLGLVYGILVGPSYTARTTFSPNIARVSASRLAGLAAQFGLSVGTSLEGESVEFYADLLQSREILEAAAFTQYRFSVDRGGIDSLRGDLVELLGVDGDTPDEIRHNVVQELRDHISVRTNQDAGLLVLDITAPWVELAERVGRRLLDLLNEFNLQKRQTRASAERTFVEARVRLAQQELKEAEASLERFLEVNRRYQQSPRLQFEAARLQRIVDLRQQVYTNLAQAHEEARIEEVRDTPVLTVVDRPEGSARKEGGPIVLGVIGLVFGGVAGVVLAFLMELLREQRGRAPGDFAEFQNLGRNLLNIVLPTRIRKRVPSLRHDKPM